MNKIKEQIIESCLTEICRKETKEKLTKELIDPFVIHIINKFKFITYVILFIIVLTYIQTTYIFYKIKKL